MSTEGRRLAALRDYDLLDGPADPELEAVVRLVRAVTGSSSATLNLIDADRQCQLVTAGFTGADSARRDSMCAAHFLDGAVVHTPDASTDPRFAAGPWVDGRRAAVRSYASAPLVTADGHALGTLCAFDGVPRQLTEEQLAGLTDLAQIVLALFERHREARRLQRLAAAAEEQRALVDLLLAEAVSRQDLTDAVLDSIGVGVVACDTEGRLTLFNRTAHDWHGALPDPGLDPAEQARVHGLFEADGVTPLTTDRVPLQQALTRGGVHGAEIAIVVPGRAPVVAVCSGRSLHGPGGALVGAVVAMTDVTADRLQRAELQRSNADLEHFAGIAGHDLAAPLSVVAGYLELLAEETGDQLDERARGWVATTRSSVVRMQSLIASLLAYARAGGATCAPAATDTRVLAELALADLATSVEASGAEVELAALPVVHGDPVQLRQLLQNLIGNAIAHRDPVRQCRVRVTGAEVEAGWELAVADDGPGVAEEDRRAVFAMFATTAHGATAPGDGRGPRRGHGIGLATCQRIVERHGGRIWVEETPGGGATVRFTLAAPGRDPSSAPGVSGLR